MNILKRPFCLVIIFLTTFIAQAQEPTVTLEFDTATIANDVVQKYVSAVKKGDIAGISGLLANDAMVYGLGGGLDSLNVAEHKTYWSKSFSNYNHSISKDLYLPVKVVNSWNEGEWLLTWGLNTITNKKTGKTSMVPYHIAFLIADGKIASISYYLDYVNLMSSQGFKITPPN